MALLRYISHPEVVIDAGVPVGRWPLTTHGRSRIEAVASAPWVQSVSRIISSGETKALEAASVLADVLEQTDIGGDGSPGQVIVVGHGGVGTLLWCHLAGLAIDGDQDQPFAGHVWTYDCAAQAVVHPWRPIESPDIPLMP